MVKLGTTNGAHLILQVGTRWGDRNDCQRDRDPGMADGSEDLAGAAAKRKVTQQLSMPRRANEMLNRVQVTPLLVVTAIVLLLLRIPLRDDGVSAFQLVCDAPWSSPAVAEDERSRCGAGRSSRIRRRWGNRERRGANAGAGNTVCRNRSRL